MLTCETVRPDKIQLLTLTALRAPAPAPGRRSARARGSAGPRRPAVPGLGRRARLGRGLVTAHPPTGHMLAPPSASLSSKGRDRHAARRRISGIHVLCRITQTALHPHDTRHVWLGVSASLTQGCTTAATARDSPTQLDSLTRHAQTSGHATIDGLTTPEPQ